MEIITTTKSIALKAIGNAERIGVRAGMERIALTYHKGKTYGLWKRNHNSQMPFAIFVNGILSCEAQELYLANAEYNNIIKCAC